MRIWTIQPETVYASILETGIYRCKPALSVWLSDYNFANAYKWLNIQMESRIGKKPDEVKYPVWAWHTLYGKHKKPDLRLSEFRFESENSVCLELEIPNKKVLLSDEEDWHFVLNNWFNTKYKSNLDFDEADSWFENLPESKKQQIKEKSWESIFDVSNSQFIQATFWELKEEDIIAIRHFKGATK